MSEKFKLMQKLRGPSRLQTQPHFKLSKNKKKEEKPFRRSDEIKSFKKSIFFGNLKLNKTSFTNIHKSSLICSSLNKSNPQSHQSNHEFKKYKLSDFGLCVNIKKSQPLQFGCNDYLAPEICQMGPDSSKVIIFNLNN